MSNNRTDMTYQLGNFSGKLNSIELFTGAGGLAMGIARAGFRHLAVVEWDHDSCETVRHNQMGGYDLVRDWPVYETDVRAFDYGMISESVDLVAGGPPCQPFSLAGRHRGSLDSRDMWSEAVRAVRELKPRAFMFENVKGLLRPSFSEYFNYIILQLTYPELPRDEGEVWREHWLRLKRLSANSKSPRSWYKVEYRLLHAADYGVPQKRERVVIVGFRSDVEQAWSFPKPTHSHDALIWDQWVVREYWKRHGVSGRIRPPDDNVRLEVERLNRGGTPPPLLPWRTTRDVIADLPEISSRKPLSGVANHIFQAGAKVYPGHTGSVLDEPAKTLKAGAHGVPGGENMLVLPTGKCRYFSVREASRIQCFPDRFVFPVSWTESMRQLGNAVPVQLAQVVAESVKLALIGRFDAPIRHKEKKHDYKRELQPA